MNIEQIALDLLQLLLSLESWCFSNNHRLPDYLHDKLLNSVEILRKEVLDAAKNAKVQAD